MKFNKTATIMALASLLFGSFGCSEDNTLTPLDGTVAELKGSSFNSLSFSWSKVKGAIQYSYQLSETATGEILVRDVTQSTTASFSDLKASTDYTLTVLAYAALESDYTTSEPVVLTARTADIVPLDTPVLEWSREVNTFYVEWGAVESAQYYYYVLYDGDNNVISEDWTSATYAGFENMRSGTYTCTVVAQTEIPGLSDSEEGRITFEFERERVEIWRLTGVYTSSLFSQDWTAELVAYDDNSYTIESWYGVEGYDFTFKTNDSDEKISVSGYDYDGQSYRVPTGLADGPENISLFADQSSMTGSSIKGDITLKVSDGTNTGEDSFRWELITCTIDDLCGDWIRHYTCYDNYYGEGYDNTMSVTITKVDDNTICIPLPLYNNEYANAVIDFGSMTYSIAPTAMNVGFIFASIAGESVPLTGLISPTGFTIHNWGMFWGGYNDYLNTTMEFYRADEGDETK